MKKISYDANQWDAEFVRVKPLHVNGGYHCPVHNAAVGGVPLNQHKLNNAANIVVPDGMTFEEFRRACTFGGIGS